MKITIARSALLPALLRANSATANGGALPVLNCLLLTAFPGGALTVTGSNLETQIGAETTADIAAGSAIAVSGQKMVDVVRLQPDDSVLAIAREGEKLIIKNERRRYALATMPSEGFPSMGPGEIAATVCLTAGTLLEAIRRVRFAVAHNDVRYYLNGVALQLEPDLLRLVASDGHRLAVYATAIEPGCGTHEVIVPAKSVDELVRLMKSVGQPATTLITLNIGTRGLTAHLPNAVLTSALVEGRYADWRRVVPRTYQQSFQVDPAGLCAALLRVTVLANPKFHGVALRMAADELTITAQGLDGESADDAQPISELTPDTERTVGYNAHYLIDAFKTAGGKSCCVSFSDNDQMLITEADCDEWTAMVSPMRL